MNYPVLIIRKDDKQIFIHLGEGMYRTEWGIVNGSISEIPYKAFNEEEFSFYYK